MRPRPLLWLVVSVLCFAGAFYFWRLGERWAARGEHGAKQRAEVRGQKSEVGGQRSEVRGQTVVTGQGGALNSPAASQVLTNRAANITNRFALRLTNTTATISQLQRSESAILLQNALLDTTKGAPAIPAHLLAQGDPGTWIVQARGPINNGFRSLLQDAGATIVSYIPNNAYLVRASQAVADQLQAGPLTQAVLPYEPYYKLTPSLLNFAVAQKPLPANNGLNVLLFADAADQAIAALQNLGVQIVGSPERTPFGPVIRVSGAAMLAAQSPAVPPGALLPAIAGLPGVQEVEWALARTSANDLSRARIGIATDPLVTTNYLGLTGTNVMVNVNDTGIDATHPDLAPRVFGNTPIALVDTNGHGTHVAGIIASSGGQSSTVTNASGPFGPYSGTNNQFRGMAPEATLFSVPFGLETTPFTVGETMYWPSDVVLQETPAKTNCFISNNSWNYTGPDDYPSYDLHAASYDAAVRDALPNVPGSQPLLIVFSAGNDGGGSDDGTGGNTDTILSPATAKNVITVGAIEQFRNITNIVTVVTDGTTNTSQPWLGMTDSSNEVASFSARGNVGVGVEGKYGRFKPDVVAPGTFVVSTKSQQWDTNAYYNPTSALYFAFPNLIIYTNELRYQSVSIPPNAVQWNLSVSPNTNSPVPFPGLALYVRQAAPPATNAYDAVGTNQLSLPPAIALNPVGVDWWYGVGNSTTQTVAYDFFMGIVVTNELGDYLGVLEGMNNGLGPYYRYETGTSMSAADVSGTLALMQEFFQQRLGRTNSPALMKALLINGARSLGGSYDFATQPTNSTGATGNSQGWGLINLPTTLQPGLTNAGSTANSVVMIDQNPATALATGQSQTFHLTLSPAATTQPLRVTLVWTDPPGNPVASVKLVNDLDLVVTGADPGTNNYTYYGNDIGQGDDFNQAWQTNTVPNVDSVNNVENVYLNPAAGFNATLATNYTITVYGHRVNVNAVTAQTNNVSQDYALVVSTGDGLIAGATVTLNTNVPVVSLTQPLVTPITNTFGVTSPDFSGGILLNQRAGANTQLQGTNTIILTNDADGVLTVGMTNQWHFYVITNNTGFTNAAFLTFTPPTLSIPRMGVFADSVDNATRPEADIDLFVAPPTLVLPPNYELTNLWTNVLVAADKSVGRGGTEMVVYSNAVNGLYYLGVQCQDQMAAQYAIMGVFSQLPFGTSDANGDQSLIGIPTYAPIPDGNSLHPGYVQVIAICAQPITVRRVIVTNTISHQLMTDLLGDLGHAGQFDVLNNHTCVANPASGNCETCITYVYDDSDEKNVGAGITICRGQEQPSDGPGSLHNFASLDGVGPWILTMTDNQPSNIGTNISLDLFLERQPDLTAPGGVIATIQPGACREDYVTLPPNAVSLTVDAGIITATPPILFSIELCPFGGGTCKSTLVTNAVGGSVIIDLTDTPPLQPGTTYTLRTCNLGVTPITLNLKATIGTSLNTLFPAITLTNTLPQAIADDAVTDYYLTNNSHSIISSVNLGLLINDPRVSDLAITLISPNGTRVLVFENRGAGSTNGLGTFNITTNLAMQAFFTNNFNAASVGLYATGAVFQGWSVVSNVVDVLDDFTCLCESNHILALFDGAISNSLPTTNALPVTNSYPYTLSYKVNHLPWLDGMVTWWPLDVDGSDIFGGMDGLLLGDATFSTGQSVPFFDDFAGPLNPNWQAYLPTTGSGGSAPVIENYVGAPGYFWTTIGTNTVIQLTNRLSAQQRCGWRSAIPFTAQSLRYEVRFNTLNQGPGLSVDGLIEIWVFDALNNGRYDVISLFGGDTGNTRDVFATSTIDNTNYTLPYNYQTNTWYHLVIAGNPGQPVRASLFDDTGNELVGQNFAHGPSAFSEGFRIGLSQFMATPPAASPVTVAVDWAKVTTSMFGEVNQAYLGDGDATRMIVPGCEELDLGQGRGFSIEGWVWPGNVAKPAPLVEWYNSTPPTNQSPTGVQFWLALTNGYGSVGATIWDTNMLPHVITTLTNALTNGGWQHVALTYDTNSGMAALYVNGLLTNGLPLVTNNLGHFVPLTAGDVYLGFDPVYVPIPINYPNFASIAGLNLVGPAAQSGSVLRLTPAAQQQLGDAWATNKQPCAAGFTTSFQFRMSNQGNGGGDEIWFAVQNDSPTSPAGYCNFGNGTNYVSVFLNARAMPTPNDVSGNSIAIVTNNNFVRQTALTPLGITLKDGAVHTVQATSDGTAINVWLDSVQVLTNVPVSVSTIATDTNGYAWVGFGAYCGSAYQDQDILSWTFGKPQNGTALLGGLDEFSLYNRALSPCEVNAIYHAGSGGKYGTNVLVCPVVTAVTLSNAPAGIQTFLFTNGVSWVTNGPHWETNTIFFSTTGTNPTPFTVRGYNPYSTNDPSAPDNLNAVVDDFVLSELVQQVVDGLLYFTDNTNLAALPIKFAPTPYTTSNFPPVLLFTNDFSYATAGVYQVNTTIQGDTNGPGIGLRDWTVTAGLVAVVSNTFLDPLKTNWLAMATGAVQCLLPTIPGHRYELTYNVRGPCAVGWWNGSVDPLSLRALDLISGNNGAFLYGATNITPGFVGSRGFFFNGQTEPPPPLDPDIWAEDVDDPSGQIELADPPQLQFTNAFTIEGWIMPTIPTNATVCGTEQIFFRGYPEPFDCRGLGDPYWLALEPTVIPTLYNVHFHIADAHYGTAGVDVLTTNAPVIVGGGTNNGWWHLAAVFDKPFTNFTVITNGTNYITFTTNQLRLYLNGTLIASNYTTISPYGALDPSLNPGVDIGERCRFDWTEPFAGFMDEVTVYGRALTPPEISAIASAGSSGKADLVSVPPALSLAKLSVTVDGIQLGVGYGDNAQWTTQAVQFTALDTNAVVTIQSLLPGTLLDGVSLTEMPSDLYYLPEESLSALAGEDGFGVWTLEIWDSRGGPANTNSQLVQWQVDLQLAPSNPPPVITLEHGITYSNSLAAHSAQYFIVPVPQWATRATNTLEYGEQVHTTTTTLPATVFFNPTNFPGLADLALLQGPPYPRTRTLTTNGTPQITNGEPYYLLVTNPNPVGLTFGLQVAFDITTLENCQMLFSNVVGVAGIPRYFQFDVPTNIAQAGLPPQAVSFWVSNTACNLKVVLSEHLPLPDLDHFDYTSQQPCTNDQIIMLVTNTTPFPIQTNRWYVGVFNTSTTNVFFSAQACMTAPYPVIIPLTNGIPYIVATTNSPFVAPPGPPQSFFFDFLLIPQAPGVLFELYNLSGNADLVLQQDVPPTMPPYFFKSDFEGTTPQQIVLRTDAGQPASVFVPDLRGHWYLGIYNNGTNKLTYTIRATLPDSDLLLSSGQPLRMSLSLMAPPHGVLLNWNSVVGERYFVQFTPSIAAPITWTNLGLVVASTPLTTFEVLPVPPNGGFFRVIQVYSPQPILHIESVPTNSVRLYWSVVYQGYALQYKNGILGPWSNLTTTPFPPYPSYPPAVQEGLDWAAYDKANNAVPKFYRLQLR